MNEPYGWWLGVEGLRFHSLGQSQVLKGVLSIMHRYLWGLIRRGRTCSGAFRERPWALTQNICEWSWQMGPTTVAGGGWCRALMSGFRWMFQMWLLRFCSWCIGVTNSALGLCFSDNTSALTFLSSHPHAILFFLTHYGIINLGMYARDWAQWFALILLQATIISFKHWLHLNISILSDFCSRLFFITYFVRFIIFMKYFYRNSLTFWENRLIYFLAKT